MGDRGRRGVLQQVDDISGKEEVNRSGSCKEGGNPRRREVGLEGACCGLPKGGQRSKNLKGKRKKSVGGKRGGEKKRVMAPRIGLNRAGQGLHRHGREGKTREPLGKSGKGKVGCCEVQKSLRKLPTEKGERTAGCRDRA